MRVITHSRIVAAQDRFPGCASALDYWYRLMRRGTYGSFAELKSTFGSVDKVGSLYVFDIGGNKLRLIAAIHFNVGKVFIRYVLTHKEYDDPRWELKEDIR